MQEHTISWTVGVSFAKVPLTEMAHLGNEILKLGWTAERRGDPWMIAFRKDFPGGTSVQHAEAEVKNVLGDYWVGAEDFDALRSSNVAPDAIGEGDG